MALRLKPLSEQVVVVTGASSGIGLATARTAARSGAAVVVASRSHETLRTIAREIQSEGGHAFAVACDVADRSQVESVAAECVREFGRIDTWVNNAGVGLYGRLDEVPDQDSRRLFDVNFWGVVHGSLVAMPYLRKQGGALINVGSEVSESFVPLLGMYTASKHAVKGFTDVLRAEIQHLDEAPVSITLIEPTAVNTPFPRNARNCMDREAILSDPKVDPQDVADAILKAAVKPSRIRRVGRNAKIYTAMAKLAPAILDATAAGTIKKLQSDRPAQNPRGALDVPSEIGGVAGQESLVRRQA